jgi:DNA polymerase III alpha subunit
MANKIGFTLDEAEILRRIVGKKKTEEIKAWKKKIESKIKENEIPKEVGEILWKILEDSANYSFNKSHSLAYAALAAVTIYLKFNHPQQFFLSLLKMSRNEPDPIGEISKIQKEMHEFDIKLLPPHIIKSEMDFSIEDKDIRLLAYRILVEKFNTEYSTLSEEQKGILKEYINNVSDTKQLKSFLNNKIEQVKEEIEGLIPQIEDKVTVIKLTEVLNLIKPILNKTVITCISQHGTKTTSHQEHPVCLKKESSKEEGQKLHQKEPEIYP